MRSPVTVHSLKESLAKTASPTLDDSIDYRIAKSLGTSFLARARSGATAMLIPMGRGEASVGRSGGGFVLRPSNSVAFRHGGRVWQQPAAIIECTSDTLS